MSAVDTSISTLHLNGTIQAMSVNETTPAYATTGWYFNITSSALEVNGTTSFFDFNQTTQYWYFNETNSPYDVATVSSPITGLTYTLFCITCCLTLFGLVGNSLILVSMFKLRNRSKGHRKLLTSLAICDTFALVSWALEQPCTHDVLGLDIRAMDTAVCKISWAIMLIATYSSSGVVFLICLERFLAVWFPLRSRHFLSDRNISIAMCVCLIPIVVIYTVTPVLYTEIKDGICYPNFPGTEYSTVLNRLPDTTFYNASNGFILVFFALNLSVFTPLISIKLYKQRNIRRQLTTNGPNAQLNATEFKTSVKLVAVVIAQLSLVVVPAIGCSVGFVISGIPLDNNTRSACTLSLLINHSINFLLYNAFDSEFRRHILALLGCAKTDKTPTVVITGNLHASTSYMDSDGN